MLDLLIAKNGSSSLNSLLFALSLVHPEASESTLRSAVDDLVRSDGQILKLIFSSFTSTIEFHHRELADHLDRNADFKSGTARARQVWQVASFLNYRAPAAAHSAAVAFLSDSKTPVLPQVVLSNDYSQPSVEAFESVWAAGAKGETFLRAWFHSSETLATLQTLAQRPLSAAARAVANLTMQLGSGFPFHSHDEKAVAAVSAFPDLVVPLLLRGARVPTDCIVRSIKLVDDACADSKFVEAIQMWWQLRRGDGQSLTSIAAACGRIYNRLARVVSAVRVTSPSHLFRDDVCEGLSLSEMRSAVRGLPSADVVQGEESLLLHLISDFRFRSMDIVLDLIKSGADPNRSESKDGAIAVQRLVDSYVAERGSREPCVFTPFMDCVEILMRACVDGLKKRPSRAVAVEKSLSATVAALRRFLNTYQKRLSTLSSIAWKARESLPKDPLAGGFGSGAPGY